jgi:hypothetical protein
LLQDFINSKTTGRRELAIGFSDISQLMIRSFDKVQADYDELKIAAENFEMPSSQKVMIDVYMSYFDQYNSVFQENKKYAEDLAKIDGEIIDYLIFEFAKHKNYASEIIVNGLINNDLNLAKEFGYHAGQHCIQKIGFSFFNTIELNALKEIINNQRASKIFLFTGALHAHNMNEILLKCGYEKIYENIATPIEMINQLSAKGINVISTDVAELIPVSAELLRKLSEKELTKELFELSSMGSLKIEEAKVQVANSWMRKICNFLGL